MKKIIKSFLIFAIIVVGFFCIHKINSSIMWAAKAADLININIASLEELDALPGIGPIKAQAIIDYRETNGPFESIEEIINVSGIGDATFEKIKNLITVEKNSVGPDNAEDAATSTAEEIERATSTPNDDFSSTTPKNSKESAEAANENNNSNAEAANKLGDVVINEFVSDPADNEVEWVELYCRVDRVINLSRWTIEEGSGAKTNFNNGDEISKDNNFLLF